MNDRRRLLRTAAPLGLAALGLPLLGLGGCSALRSEPVSVAAHVWTGYEPLFMAQREGWLDPVHARVVETGSASDSLQALARGEVQGAALTLDEVLRARADGLPLSIVLVFDVSTGADKVMVRPAVRSLSDLRGRTIAFESGALGELMLAEVLRAAALRRQDVRPLPMPVDHQLAAWEQGRADAFVTYEPVASRLAAQGARELFDSRQLPHLIVDVLALHERTLAGRRAASVRHLVGAHLRAVEHLRLYPQDALHRMAAHLRQTPAEVQQALRGLHLPTLFSNHQLLGGPTPELLASARHVQAVLARAGLIRPDDGLEKLLRADFLPPVLGR